MLSELHIRNIAVIREADLAFGEGLNVFTGETGAGKSILIGAIGAVLGWRTPKELIRTGEEKASVSALFRGVSLAVRAELAQLGIESGEELLLSRSITPESTACRVNGQPVTVAMLRQIGALLMNIHGQMDTQMLASPDSHRQFVDSFGGLDGERERYAALYERLRALERRLASLQTDARERERRLDLLRYQTQEIAACALTAGEEEDLQARRRVIRSAEQLTQWLSESRALLSGTDEADGAVALLQRAAGGLSRAGEVLDAIAPLAQRVETFAYELEEAAGQVRDALEELEFDPRELDGIEARLDTIHRLKKKYGGSVEEILAFYETAAAQLAALENADVSAEALQRQVGEARGEAEAAAARLTERRRAAGEAFSARVRAELCDLDMPRVEFFVGREAAPLSETGADAIEFLLSVNPGEDPKPLSKIASGGEMSRIMLAIKNVISAADDLGTLIFDEVDTGISGRAAQKVGAKLRAAARDRQILCVTHLAQVAAFADRHLLIEKEVEGGRTFTHVVPLGQEERIHELARIMSGEAITEAALESAAELYAFSQKA